MENVKVCFIYDPEPNEKFLNILKKMTPGRSGLYKNIQGVTTIEEADYCVVIDSTTQLVPFDKTIMLQAHPSPLYYKDGYANSDKIKGKYIISLDVETAFGEWWLDADYDSLRASQPMVKTKKLCCIISNARNIPGHKDRIAFLEKLCSQHPGMVDVYGRIKPTADEPGIRASYKGQLGPDFSLDTYWFGKDAILSQYEYSLELEALVAPNYFSERIYDSMLMWTVPISWGCPNMDEYFGAESDSWWMIDISTDYVGSQIEKILDGDFYSVADLSKARDLLLDKYQIWAKVHDYIERV